MMAARARERRRRALEQSCPAAIFEVRARPTIRRRSHRQWASVVGAVRALSLRDAERTAMASRERSGPAAASSLGVAPSCRIAKHQALLLNGPPAARHQSRLLTGGAPCLSDFPRRERQEWAVACRPLASAISECWARGRGSPWTFLWTF